MANLLAREQADIIIQKAIKAKANTGRRLGVGIWLQLTLKQISNILTPDKDIFYVKDDDKALEIFNKYCVEVSDEPAEVATKV